MESNKSRRWMNWNEWGVSGMERRTFLKGAAGAVAATLVAPKAVRADELPLGPLPGTRYPDPRVAVLDPRADGQIQRQAAECTQRHRRVGRRRDLVHRSRLRHFRQL